MAGEALAVAARVESTRAEGPGLRYALWTQGCTLDCVGCCNPQFQVAQERSKISVAALLLELGRCHARCEIAGITLLGGEPLQQLRAITAYCAGAAQLGLGVILFSGYTFEQAQALSGFAGLWPHIDTLIAGPYVAQQAEPDWRGGGRTNIGSTNQVLHHRSDRYQDPGLWRGPARAELSYGSNGQIHIHGAARLSARIKRMLVKSP